MEPLFRNEFIIPENACDCFNRLKTSMVLSYAQEMAGEHSALMGMDWDTLAERRMFWAVIRHRIRIDRLPGAGEKIIMETWPGPATRVAYPRSTVAYDEQGNELFRLMSLWVLMDLDTRAMILPGKSGVEFEGLIRGTELAAPGSLVPKPLSGAQRRRVCYTDLDRNGHMNNTHYLDWVDDLLPAAFHGDHVPREIVICYLSEIREGEEPELRYELLEGGCLQVEAHRSPSAENGKPERCFAVREVF